MADYSSKQTKQLASQNLSQSRLVTITAIDDSFQELPHKPIQKNDTKKLLPRKQSEQQLLALEKPISNNQTIDSKHGKDVSSIVILSEGNDSKSLSQIKNEQYYAFSMSQQNTKLKKSKETSQIKDKRSSINSYQKRVVELNLNSTSTNFNIVQDIGQRQMGSYTTKNLSAKQLSIDITDIPIQETSSTLIINDHSKINSDRLLKPKIADLSQNDYSTDKSVQLRVHPFSSNISPKNPTPGMYSSPRLSINSINNTMTKSKLMIRKQAIGSKNVGTTINLNKSDQYNFNNNNNITKEEPYANCSQHIITANKQNSPPVKQIFQSNQNSSNKKTLFNTSQSSQQTSQLLRNLSQDQKTLRIPSSSRDQTLNNCGYLSARHSDLKTTNESKRESLRYYSPNQMSLNKALTRISSVGELKRVKEQISKQRKSIQSSSKTIVGNTTSGLSTMLTAQMVLNQQRKNQSTHFKKKAETKQVHDYENPQDDEEGDDDNDYLTNQEKFWNAIESKQSLKILEDYLKKKDVKVDAKNMFDDGWSALHYAVHEGYFDAVKLLIERYHCPVDLRSNNNKTPFHLACIRGDEVTIKYLIQRNASACAVDRDGCTPLHYLCELNHLELISIVLPLSQGAQDVRNRFGFKPIDLIKDKDIKKKLRSEISQRRQSSQSESKGRLSTSRDRNNVVNNIKIHSIKEDKIQDCIQQMFRKFSLYKNTSQRGYQQMQTKQISKEFSIENSSNKQTQDSQRLKTVQSPSNLTLNSARKQLSKASSRLTIGTSSSSSQSNSKPLSMPQSCKNAEKSSQNTNKFATNNNTISSKTSPNKINFKKVLEQKFNSANNTDQSHTMQASSSQRDLIQSKQYNKAPETKRLTSIKSQANLNIKTENKVQKKALEIKVTDTENETHKDSIPQKNGKSSALADEQNVYSSQRTVESSQINDQSATQKNLKLTLSLSDDPQNIVPEKPQKEKIGPWSFIAHQLLGTGSFGEVFLVEKISDGKYYAMKVLSKNKIMGHNLTRYAMTERNVLSVADHPFIVKLNYAFQTQEKLFLILDYCPGGDLAEYLQLEKRFNEDKTRLYAAEMLLAIEELHRKDIIFRDLKPDNVVLDSEGHAMLTDFGLSKEGVMDNGMAKSFCGSYAYLAPEMLKKLGHGKAVDWYLLGVVIYEMLCGIPPYYANNKDELFENIKHATLDLPPYLSVTARDLIVKLLNRNPKKRLGSINGADEIKKHAFFKSIDWVKLFKRQYKPPEPYLRKRFDNFLQLSPAMQTNIDVYESLRKQVLLQSSENNEQHIPGWSFVQPKDQ